MLALAIGIVPRFRRFALAAANLMILSILIFSSNLMLMDRAEPVMINTWVLFVILSVGLYPTPLRHSLTVFAIAFACFAIRYLAHGRLSDRFMQIAVVNTLIAVAVSTPVKFFVFRARRSEFYARKRLEDANREISELNKELKSLDGLKSDFIANISHELRTPLTLILGPIESCLDGSIEVDDYRSFLEGLRVHASRLKSLVNDILDFSRIDAGKMEILLRETDVGAMLSGYVEGFSQAAKAKGVSLRLEDRLEGALVPIDQDKFDKTITNILSNALKFTDGGGAISLVARRDEANCYIEVADTGPGIPPDMVDAVFERFRQVDSSSRRKHEGSGIGLALAREFMAMHGGEIRLSSRQADDRSDDHGSVFTLVFPLGERDPAKSSPIESAIQRSGADSPTLRAHGEASVIKERARPASGDSGDSSSVPDRGARPRVLVVEDNSDMASFIASVLEREFRPVLANDGAEALRLLEGSSFDIVLADVMMPVMDGGELLRRIRCDDRLAFLPVVMLSAKADERTKIDNLELGAVDFLTKPFNARELVARLRSQAHLKQLRDGLSRGAEAKGGEASKSLTEETKRKIELAINYLKRNFRDEITRESLAEAMGMSPDHFGRMFKQCTGKRLVEHLNKLRLDSATRQLRESEMRIIDIALENGFDSLRSFNRIFASEMGTNPSKYRRRQTSLRA
jgi:signal transduction histidine kinase/DNA-binding response OmpR family regulator